MENNTSRTFIKQMSLAAAGLVISPSLSFQWSDDYYELRRLLK